MLSFSMLFLNELVKTTQNDLCLIVLSCWTLGKTFVRGKENYSLAEKKELRELVEKYKKEDDKEVKAICHFSMQKVPTRSN